ncbi:PREDICTED: protein BREVIS RADIX [Tarenaya hassleriana]|uniref:protein BREVIS RADIX n=1 Tax=Tarenaya hassleriana TaxID=28532 RepID=UPI00053C6232|nr:PREDICTED: protein BREVIS RADIX [Tarenaya hassleriana]XP_010518939.1 PREDICTED: protein BREVIS RADIX [Tarenaya hassleriana]XP_010518940.1 PREDICTED: protein BREVIS RADIX [Tarenaya hassleriana]
MFTCIACTKQMADGGEEVEGGARGSSTPNTKEAVKSLTTQIKDMALKFSGAYKQCKPCTGSSGLKKGPRPYPDFDTASEGVPYPYPGGSSTSTPAWDFTSSTHHPAGRPESRFTAVYGGDRESISAQSCDVVVEDDHEPKEWMAQVEPGVHITFVSLPSGGNDLKRIRFSREMFDKWQAQRWWGENYDKIVELYNVQRFNRQALQTPARSEDQRDSTYSKLESARESKDWTPRQNYRPPPGASVPHHFYGGPSHYGTGGQSGPSMDAARTTTSSRDEPPSISNASEMQAEWVEEDEPGVYITIRQLADGTRELRRVRFSRERFGEVHAKTWWEQNRDRIQSQYL